MYTDSHCHLAMTSDGEAQLARARAAGVRGFVVPATRLDDAAPALALAKAHPDVWAAVGFHPHEAKDFDAAAEAEIRRLASDPRIVAIGEIGLDYHYDYSPREVQRAVLETHLAIARSSGRPAIIHNRESTDDLVTILEGPAGDGVTGVLHSYTESYDVAARLIDRGFFISFSGIITFRSADSLRDVARRLPHDRVLIETDTPYLAPVPHRGKKNEPAFVTEVAGTLASLWNVDAETVARSTSANFERLFGVRIPS
jgi:TatD DNase family protein